MIIPKVKIPFPRTIAVGENGIKIVWSRQTAKKYLKKYLKEAEERIIKGTGNGIEPIGILNYSKKDDTKII